MEAVWDASASLLHFQHTSQGGQQLDHGGSEQQPGEEEKGSKCLQHNRA